MKKNLSINIYGIEDALIQELWEHIRASAYPVDSVSFDISKDEDTPVKVEVSMPVYTGSGDGPVGTVTRFVQSSEGIVAVMDHTRKAGLQ